MTKNRKTDKAAIVEAPQTPSVATEVQTNSPDLLEATQAALREAEEQITALMHALSETTDQRQQLAEQLAASEGQIELLTGEITAYAAEHQAAQKTDPARQERLADLQASVFEMNAQKVAAEARTAALQARLDVIERCRLFQVMTSINGEIQGKKLLVIAPDASAAIVASKVAPEVVANVLLVSSDIRCI